MYAMSRLLLTLDADDVAAQILHDPLIRALLIPSAGMSHARQLNHLSCVYYEGFAYRQTDG
jgi:hypothetical protein